MSLARSFSLQWIASAYSAIISILLTFLYARLLGPETFGNYNYLLTLAALYAILQDGGFRTLIFRELTSPSFQNLKDHLVSIALGNNFLITIIGALLILAIPIKDSFLLALAIFSFGLVTTVTIFSSEFKGKGNFSADAQWRIISRTLGAIGSVVFILLFSPTLSDQYSEGPFDVSRIIIAINSIIITNDSNNIAPINKSKYRFIYIL
jgi:O-antigen/teichoic acid export membrane protein